MWCIKDILCDQSIKQIRVKLYKWISLINAESSGIIYMQWIYHTVPISVL